MATVYLHVWGFVVTNESFSCVGRCIKFAFVAARPFTWTVGIAVAVDPYLRRLNEEQPCAARVL
jgi:hypothetical protein